MSIRIESSAFKPGQPIPTRFTADGDNVSPALSWSGLPNGTAELALICDDPDAPVAEPWVHWVLYGIRGDCSGLAENVAKGRETLAEPPGSRQGTNDFKKLGYGGPAPPRGHGTHHYHFKLYALDAPIVLPPGARKQQLLDAMSGHVLDQGELVGTYRR